MRDPRFVISHAGDPEYSLVTRSSDGQMLFLANLLSKMKDTPLGSRIAEVHNGSSLFTGDAGQGESNIRRWIIENDWLEAVVALPLNLFYNTGIATYVWVLANRKPVHRRGKVQLIDATAWSRPLRKNLGKKNCELAPDDIERVLSAFMDFKETEQSRILPNAAFGYWKVTVERPLRLRVDLTPEAVGRFRATCAEAGEEALAGTVEETAKKIGPGPHLDWAAFLAALARVRKPRPREAKLLLSALAVPDAGAEPMRKRPGEYEPDPELRDTEQIPLLEEGGIEGFMEREVRPHAPDAWVDMSSIRTGYEISFNRYFYKPAPLRELVEIKADILAVERETAGLLAQIVGGGGA